MALRQLLQTGAVLDLCGGDVVLPSEAPLLSEGAQRPRNHTRVLRARLSAGGSDLNAEDVAAMVLDPKTAAKSAGSRGGRKVGDYASDMQRNSPTLAALTETLTIGAGLLRRWAQEQPTEPAKAVAAAFENCLQLARTMPRPQLKEELPSILDAAAGKDGGTALLQRLHHFVVDLVMQVRALTPGKFMLIPVAWLRGHVSEASAGADDGHALLLVLIRGSDDKAEEFTIAVINTGEGLEHHPVRAAGAAPSPERPVRQVPLLVSQIPRPRLLSAAFWMSLYRQVTHPHSKNGPQLFYGTLLPFLNQKPLSENFIADQRGWLKFMPVPVSGDGSCAICLEKAMYFCCVLSGMSADDAAWSGVRLRWGLVTAVKEALEIDKSVRPPSTGELALTRVLTASLARSCVQFVDSHGEQSHQAELEDVRKMIREIDAAVQVLDSAASGRGVHALQPAPLRTEEIAGKDAPPSIFFDRFDRLVAQDVEHLKGGVEPPQIFIHAPLSKMPTSLGDPFEAAECCRLTSNLLTLLANQQDKFPQSSLSRFALITHLMTHLLPMPLPVNHPKKRERCFWMQEMKYETKADLMRHLCLIARHFAAVCFTLRPSRETDGARVVVAAAIVAVMDALMRRPLGGALYGSLVALHYSGEAQGPTQPYGVDHESYKDASDALLLVEPEHHALRSLTLDYFESIRQGIADDHVLFQFDQTMGCSEGDRSFVEALGLSIGVDSPAREAPLLITGQRPDLTELFLELTWFRDVVFLWKMLLLPGAAMPEPKPWRAMDALLQWQWDGNRFLVKGFGKQLNADQPRKPSSYLTGMMQWLYRSEDKAVSGASATNLAGAPVKSEDDVLFLQNVPAFNGMLKPAESELLLSYLTAPYLRVPLLLGFFATRDHISLLREPQLQMMLDAALFEAGPWQPQAHAREGPPKTIPAQDRRHLSTPSGLLFNELVRSPKVVLDSLLSMLHLACEKDTGRPDSGNEGLILYLIRLAVRVETFITFVVQHARKGSYLSRRMGASYEALVRGLPVRENDACVAPLISADDGLRRELQSEVLQMLQGWAKFAMKKREELAQVACRIHAHLALLCKNMTPEQFNSRDVSTFLSSQIFINTNYRWSKHDRARQDAGGRQSASHSAESQQPLGVREVELFDLFEAKRSLLVRWLIANPSAANIVFTKVEQVVSFRELQSAGADPAGEKVSEWVENPLQLGDFVRASEAQDKSWTNARPNETYRGWLQRVTRGAASGAAQISINHGLYGNKQEGLELLPEWAAESTDYRDAYGNTEVHCSDREKATKRVWKDIVGHSHAVQLWSEDDRGIEADVLASYWLTGRVYNRASLQQEEVWLPAVLEPVRFAVPGLQAMELRFREAPDVVSRSQQVWLGAAFTKDANKDRNADKQVLMQLKEVRVQRLPPLVEVYDVVEYGRQYYRCLAYSSDAMWSFHAPAINETLMYNAFGNFWSLSAGQVDAIVPAASSVLVQRQLVAGRGRELFLPNRFLQGLIPQALLERYSFWRDSSKAMTAFVGDEVEAADAPTRLFINLEIAASAAVTATVKRKAVSRPPQSRKDEPAVPQALWNDNSRAETEVLVNLQGSSCTGLSLLLARLDNLSHVLAWTNEQGKGGILRVELPRLRLSFTRRGDKLFCEQHSGFWLMDSACPDAVNRLVAQWGGGTVLLQNSAGETLVLISAVAEPIRPAADLAGCVLPTQLVFRRGHASWVGRLAEGSRHYHYPVHLSGAFVFAPTAAANLYLLLCRFLSWHFKEIPGMAGTISELNSGEETQLWDRFNILDQDHHADAIACRLRLILATVPFGATMALNRMDIRRLLLEYIRKRPFVCAECALSCEQELQLMDLPGGSRWYLDKEPEIVSRRKALQQLLAPTPDGEGAVAVDLGTLEPDSGFDRVDDTTFANDVGILQKITSSLHDVSYTRPEKLHMKGFEALRFLNSLFADSGLGSAAAPFPLLYELFTETVKVELCDEDDGAIWASLLLRLIGRDGQRGGELSVLRALELNPVACKEVPRWGSSDLKWNFSIGNFKLDRDSTAKLLQAAGEKLKAMKPRLTCARGFRPAPVAPSTLLLRNMRADHRRFWAPPLTKDVSCSNRHFAPQPGADSVVEFAGEPLERLVKSHVQWPKDKKAQEMLPGGAVVKAMLEQAAQGGGTKGLTPTRKQTFNRLLSSLKAAADARKSRPNLGPVQKLEKVLMALSKELADQRAADTQAVQQGIVKTLATVSKGSSSDWMRRRGGHLPEISFSACVAFLMASEPNASERLRVVSPSLSNQELEALCADIAVILCRTIRIGQVARAQRAVDELQAARKAAASDIALSLKAEAVAEQLVVSRHFTKLVPAAADRGTRTGGSPTSSVEYDPRMLVFEFLFNLMLRKTQVDLVGTFFQSASTGKSVCHQMLMGQGKTTVIAPLLTLLLADGEAVVCACMPAALLDMSRGIMLERFSSPVLQKPVLTLTFHRHMVASAALKLKLDAARLARAVLVATPMSVKSILLRQLELLDELSADFKPATAAGDATGPAEAKEARPTWFAVPTWLGGGGGNAAPALSRQAARKLSKEEVKKRSEEFLMCNDILRMFRGGIMLLDEVDLLLDPLKSELNWPLGRRVPLDLTEDAHTSKGQDKGGLRYRLPFHLLDGLFAAASGQAPVNFGGRREAETVLGALSQKISAGKLAHKLQAMPHLVILSKEFYTSELLPLLVQWASLFLQPHMAFLSDKDLQASLGSSRMTDAELSKKFQGAPSLVLKLLNLSVTWLHFHLPHILSKVHRVSYGLLMGDLLDAALQDGASSPSRRLLAVPFVGKDAPSTSSEFSHPDMAIGFTIIAYRLAGLRDGDAQVLLRVLVDEMKMEASVKFHRRAACKAYVAMVIRAGGMVRGFTEDGRWIPDLKEEEQRQRKEMAAAASAGLGEEASSRNNRSVWPLEMLDLGDPEQVSTVIEVLRNSPLAVQYFLERYAFVPNVGALDHNEMELSASAQELAGRQLFGRCLGFSGTPNDLLPKSMGSCLYSAHEDGDMLMVLSNVDVVSVLALSSWSPTSLLDEVAKARNGERPRYHALIDTGALITGMSNYEVATYLLRNGLEGLDGVVFLNEKDERIVLERDGFKTVRLAQCGLPPEQRFTFYDHVHTTGMDIAQPLTCTACLTLSKDMSFRDYAQGAFRMRGIGFGQKIEILLIPEVSALVQKALAKAEGVSEEARAKKLESLSHKKAQSSALTQQLIVDFIVWLIYNGVQAEEKRQQMLCHQNLHNVWRKAAAEYLQAVHGDVVAAVQRNRTQACVSALQKSIDFSVAAALPGQNQESMEQQLRKDMSRCLDGSGSAVFQDEAAKASAREAAERILTEIGPQSLHDESCEGSLDLSAEQVREQEQEEEQEREQQQENEQEVELEEEVEAAIEAPVERKYMRDIDAARPWILQSLLTPPGTGEEPPFYPLAEFAVNKGIMGQSCPPLQGLPKYVMMSENYFRRAWRLTSVRRIRNVICFLEYVPAAGKLRRLEAGATLSAEQRARLKEAFEMYAPNGSSIQSQDLKLLFRALDLDAEGDAAVAGSAATSWTLAQVEKEISSQAFCKMQDGRYFVALSLEEAEHLRASMHLLGPDNWPSGCGLALRCLRGYEAMPEDTLLDFYGPALSSTESVYQLEVAEQLLRFTDCCSDFQSRELNILLRSLQQTNLKDRLSWWLDVRSCRRRAQRPWQQLSIAKVFVSAGELEALPSKALLSRMRWALATQRVWPADAFRAMIKPGAGGLREAELSSGLESLGLRRPGVSPERWQEQVGALLRLIDKDGNGVIDLEEFRQALELDDSELEAMSKPQQKHVTAQEQQKQPEQPKKVTPYPQIEPGTSATLPARGPAPPPAPARAQPAEESQLGASDEKSLAMVASLPKAALRLSPALCVRQQHGRFKVKWQTHSNFEPIWTAAGSFDEKPLSLWVPVDLVPRGRFRGPRRGSNAVKERVLLGHYACSFFGAPSSVQLLEVTDERRTGLFTRHRREALQIVMGLFFPHPVRFRKMWSTPGLGAGKPLHLWEPVPPSNEYVSLGIIATVNDNEPSPQQLRCVPRAWAERVAAEQLTPVWSGGSGTSSVALWSHSSSGQLFRVATGVGTDTPPDLFAISGSSETFYTETPPGV